MEKIIIRGGRPLKGVVEVGGSKNDAVAVMAGALLVPGKTVLHNVPHIRDVHTLTHIFAGLGAPSHFRPDGALEIDATNLRTSVAPHELVRQMRASFLILGVLLARFGEASVAMPGGCDIGARPVNYHIKGLEQLGACLSLEHGIYQGRVRRFTGAEIYLEGPSPGATQHLMIAACLARGRTIIENCAREPEVANLAGFLNACGAKIEGAGTSTILIEGVERLHPCEYAVLPDRQQAGTYAIAAAATGGDVFIKHAVYDHSGAVYAKLREAGCDVETWGDGVRVRSHGGRLFPIDVKTLPHPGFPTDLQQPLVALLARAEGTSTVTENIYESRFRYVTELEKLGANVQVEGRTAIVRGVERLSGAPVTCTDLRAGAALVVAGLTAEGATEIDGLEHLDRGYENIVGRLQALGADVCRGAGEVQGGLRLCSA